MVFSSTLFLFIYLPVTLLLYYISPIKWRNIVLFVVNMVFYGWGEPIYLFLMIGAIAFDYYFGYMIGREQEKGRKGKVYLVLSVVLNLGLLFFFKYFDFFIENLRLIPGLSALQPLGITLPIGISFYTFQKMSYVIDVYWGGCKAQKSFISFGTYVSLYPQLIAGPIVRYKDVDDQLEHREFTAENFASGVSVFMVGLAKKVLLANGIGVLWDTYHASGVGSMTVLGSWLAVLAYTFQIYFDFSGYSDMAVGLGRMLGFEFMRNFEYPYISRSVTEFWRRWHISLSTWFKEYLYIPLGGNRKGTARWFFNILLVWTATGIWHGASWNFLLWGLYFAVLLILEKFFVLKALDKAPSFVGHIYAMLIIIIGWAIFASGNLTESLRLVGAMFGGNGQAFALGSDWYFLKSYLPLFVVLALASLPCWTNWFNKLPQRAKTVATAVLVILGLTVCTASMVNSSYNPFLYFRF